MEMFVIYAYRIVTVIILLAIYGVVKEIEGNIK